MGALDIIREICERKEYKSINNDIDKNIYFTHAYLLEIFDANDSYEYDKEGDIFIFKAKDNINYFLRLTYQPTKIPYCELKFGYFNDTGKAIYTDPGSITDEKKSNTIAKIYRDECIPLFEKYNKVKDMYIIPIEEDMRRYRYARMLVNKFPISNTEIIEDPPHKIIIRKKDLSK